MKSPAKLQRQILQRGWTTLQIEEAVAHGMRYKATNHETGGPATRFVHPTTGKSIIVDDASGEVLHVGGDRFRY